MEKKQLLSATAPQSQVGCRSEFEFEFQRLRHLRKWKVRAARILLRALLPVDEFHHNVREVSNSHELCQQLECKWSHFLLQLGHSVDQIVRLALAPDRPDGAFFQYSASRNAV